MTRNAIEAVALSKRFVVHSERRSTFKERVARGRAPEKKYFWALRDATFTVPAGSSLGIIGPNGSGKSTALKVLTGIYRPTSGEVTVNGSVAALLEVGAGFHPELTGRENVRLNATILGFSGRQINAMMDQIIEFADIGEHIDAPIKHYSSGMYVRLGFAVAVMVRPEILIVDEVIAVGDEEFQRKCYDYLHGLRRSGTSMIVVSHGLGQINELCDEALWLDGGRPQMIGPSRGVTRAYVEAVNAREALRHAGPASTAGSGAMARRGTGQLRVIQVEYLDLAGRPVTTATSGSPLVLRLTYTAEEYVPDASFTIAIENSEELPVLVSRSGDEAPVAIEPGRGSIDFRMDECLLAPGSYTIKTEVRSDISILDADDVGYTLAMRPSATEISGLYRQPGIWVRSAGLRVVDPVGTDP